MNKMRDQRQRTAITDENGKGSRVSWYREEIWQVFVTSDVDLMTIQLCGFIIDQSAEWVLCGCATGALLHASLFYPDAGMLFEISRFTFHKAGTNYCANWQTKYFFKE